MGKEKREVRLNVNIKTMEHFPETETLKLLIKPNTPAVMLQVSTHLFLNIILKQTTREARHHGHE